MAIEREWPELEYGKWEATRETLHRWIQLIGKTRATSAPWTNHAWHSTLQLTPRGLTTGLIAAREGDFSIELDLLGHELSIVASTGERLGFELRSEPVAEFRARYVGLLDELGVSRCFGDRPDELADRTPFAKDRTHATYDPDAATRFWRALVAAHRPLTVFRSRFVGKCSPVHFFWGALDLAVTRFSGRRAPIHPGGVPGLADRVTREAYSHEVSSAGFWPGDARLPFPAFYSYAYPEPPGFSSARIACPGAVYDSKLHEYILPYDEVRASRDPEGHLLMFLQDTYEAAADLGRWDRPLLEDSAFLKQAQDWQSRVCRLRRAA